MRQRITLAKIGGGFGEEATKLLRRWSDSRLVQNQNLWSADQWPPDVRLAVDRFGDSVRKCSAGTAVFYFAEWIDNWSMGDLFQHWLALQPNSLVVYAQRYEVFAYRLPDGGKLATRLADAGPQQFDESTTLIDQLTAAIAGPVEKAEHSMLIVLREVLG